MARLDSAIFIMSVNILAVVITHVLANYCKQIKTEFSWYFESRKFSLERKNCSLPTTRNDGTNVGISRIVTAKLLSRTLVIIVKETTKIAARQAGD